MLNARADLIARRHLQKWQRAGKRLACEPQELRNFQPEPTIPAQVGMESPLDSLSPEDLIMLVAELKNKQQPLVLTWEDDAC